MKNVICLCLAALLFTSCAVFQPPRRIVAPSVSAVKSHVTAASTSVSEATVASQRSSKNIKAFKTRAEVIDYKATRALEFFN